MGNCDVFSVVNVYLDYLTFWVVCIWFEDMSVLVNVMLSLTSLMSTPPDLCHLSERTVVKFCILGVFALGVQLGFLNCDDICTCVVNKQFVLLEFLFPFMLNCSMMRIQTHTKNITLPPCVPIGCTRQEVGSLHSSETTLHSLQQTYLRPLIHTQLQMVKVHNNTKHNTIANIYIPPRDSTSTHYKTADTDIQHCIQYITNISLSVLTGDVNAHFTLLYYWFQRLPPARGGTAQRKIFHLANWSQLIHFGFNHLFSQVFSQFLRTERPYTRHRNTVETMMVKNDRKATLQALHTAAVVKAVQCHERNVVLDGRPPPISNSEKELTRKERSTLAQLISGYCRLLGSYKSRIKKDANLDVCVDCGTTPHDVKHLCVCPAHPTTLIPSDLWSRPTDAVRELSYLEARDPY